MDILKEQHYIMYIVGFLSWYLLGSVGGYYIAQKIYREEFPDIKSKLYFATIGGLGGLITVLIGLPYLLSRR